MELFKVLIACLVLVFKLLSTTEAQNASLTYEKLVGLITLKELAGHSQRNISVQCSSDLLSWLVDFGEKAWAWEMLDASGKFPPGISGGNLHSLGQFDQCLAVDSSKESNHDIKGKYCVVKIPIGLLSQQSFIDYGRLRALQMASYNEPNSRVASYDAFGRFIYNYGLCIPASCRGIDIEDLLNGILESINITGGNGRPAVTVPEHQCNIADQPEWSTADKAALGTFIGFGVILIFCTCYDVIIRKIWKESPSDNNVLIAFSMYTNTKKMLKLSPRSSKLRCVHGIRVLSIFWVMIGHRFIVSIFFPVLNGLDVIEWNDSFVSMSIYGGTVAVDSFLTLGGLLVSYVFFQKYETSSTFNVLKFYFHRIMRLIPPLAAVVFFHATLYRHCGSGPLWDTIYDALIGNCEENWWLALLLVQNYFRTLSMCAAHTWYLCLDTHLYFFSPFLIYPLIKKRKIGIANMIFWILAAQATVTTLVYLNNWPAATMPIGNAGDYYTKYYYVSHTRATPWLLGFAAGYLIYDTTKSKFKMNKFLVLILWIVSLTTIGAVVFGMKPLQSTTHEVNNLQDGTYNAFARSAWAVALIWVIFACVHGYGGPINWFLSWRIWEILAKISYSMYLLHQLIMYSLTFSSRTINDFSEYYITYIFFGDIIMTILFSYLWAMAFESPFLALEKAMFSSSEKAQIGIKPATEKSEKDAEIAATSKCD